VQPWIVGALAFYCALLATVVVSRRSWETQLVSFVLICGSVYLAPHLNSLLAANWQLLGFSQNYFDSRGVFISAMYSAPLLFIAFLQMVSSEPLSAAAVSMTTERCGDYLNLIGPSGLCSCTHFSPPSAC
jgi:hypothetical protein